MMPLEQIRIASPCGADWDAMPGNDQARFCGECRQNVYNLSVLTRAEAEALVAETEGRLCVRFHTRADGTVLTRDCPVGLRAARQQAARKVARKTAYAAAVLIACASGLERGTGRVRAVTPVRKATPAIRKADTPPGVNMGAPTVAPPPMMGGMVMPPHTLTGRIARPPHTQTHGKRGKPD